MNHIVGPLGVFGILSIILQAVGFFSPAWMIYSMEVNPKSSPDGGVRIEIEMGLWTTRACYNAEWPVYADAESEEKCGSVSTLELESRLSTMSSSMSKAGIKKLLGDWIVLQALAVCAGLSAICGIIGIFVMARNSDEKIACTGGTTLVFWLISAILILSAVGKQANDLHTYSAGSDVVNEMDVGVSLNFETPWALIISGIGGAFAAFVAVGMALFMMCRERREAPGVWMEFGKNTKA